MSPSLGTDILTWAYEDEKSVYKATLKAVADARKVRTVFLQRQPRSDRHVGMLDTLARPRMEVAASTLLRTWLLKGKTKKMVRLHAAEISECCFDNPAGFLLANAASMFLRFRKVL